ncbi:hypothetical protein ACQP1V_12635 [Microtetraspora malaysiensis]
MRIVYSRSSTAAQSLLQQRHILTEAGLLGVPVAMKKSPTK